jgi:hypothetical protein
LAQVGPPPEGICDHQNTDNGKRLGKSDVGPAFQWNRLFDEIEKLQEDESVGTTAQNITQLMKDANVISAEIAAGTRPPFIRPDGQDEVYEIIANRRVWLINPAVALARGMAPDLSNVTVINAVQLLAWPEGTL